MRLLTLTQPWATLVAVGAKNIETRSWPTSYRGPLAIHAAKGLPPGGRNALRRICRRDKFARALAPLDGSSAHPLPLGVIVAVCNLADVIYLRDTEARLGTRGELFPIGPPWRPPAGERAFGDYTPGRYAWLLEDIRALAIPLPYRGALGLTHLPAEVVAALEAA